MTGRWRESVGKEYIGWGGRTGGGDKRRDIWTILTGNSKMHLHLKYKQMHISVKTASRHKIDVSDDTCMYHILMFRHTAIWPNHSKAVIGPLQYVMYPWWLPVPLYDVKYVNAFCVSLTQQHNQQWGSKERDMHGSCWASKWQSWDCNPGVLNLSDTASIHSKVYIGSLYCSIPFSSFVLWYFPSANTYCIPTICQAQYHVWGWWYAQWWPCWV